MPTAGGSATSYAYVSDANGYWRFRRLLDVLVEGTDVRLHVLTHPGWWQAEPMPTPGAGRSLRTRAGPRGHCRTTTTSLAQAGRENIR